MPIYEYIVIFDDNELEQEAVLETIEKEEWNSWERGTKSSLYIVAEEIFKHKRDDWELSDEYEAVYIIIREMCQEYWELHRVSQFLVWRTNSHEILNADVI